MDSDVLLRPGTLEYRQLNLAMGLAGLAAFGMLYATQPLLPALSSDFGVGPSGAALTISVATGALAVVVVPATALGRRWGRARTILLALLSASLLTAVSAAAPSFGTLVALRLLAGVCLAAVVGLAMGHVAAEVHPDGLTTAMGLYVAGNSLGGVGGRLITSLMVDLGSWRWALLVLGGCAALATVLFWWLLPAPAASADAPRSGPRAARVHRELLTDPAVLAVLAIPFVLMGGFVATYNYLTYRLTEAPFDLPVTLVAAIFLAYLAGTVSSALAGRLAARLGRAAVLLPSIALMGLGTLLTVPDRLGLVVLGLLMLTGGFFAAHSVASGWAPVVGRRHPAETSALYVCAYYVGSSVFGALLGTSWRQGGWPATAGSVGALVLAGLLAAVLVARSEAGRAAGAAAQIAHPGPPKSQS